MGPDLSAPAALPDAVFDASVTGASTATHRVTLRGQQTSGSNAVTAAYTGTVDLFSVVAQEVGAWGVSFSGPAGGLAVGNYTIMGAGYFNTAQAAQFEENAAGTFSITKVDPFPGGISYVDGKFNFTVENTDTSPKTVTVDGSFQGVVASSTP